MATANKPFVPSFKVASKVEVPFITNNPSQGDRVSQPTKITDLSFNEVTRSIEVTCDDRRKRQCRIDRLANDKMVKDLQKALQEAYDKKTSVQFVAAGGADANVWFYRVM
jgi:hypothetical protein